MDHFTIETLPKAGEPCPESPWPSNGPKVFLRQISALIATICEDPRTIRDDEWLAIKVAFFGGGTLPRENLAFQRGLRGLLLEYYPNAISLLGNDVLGRTFMRAARGAYSTKVLGRYVRLPAYQNGQTVWQRTPLAKLSIPEAENHARYIATLIAADVAAVDKRLTRWAGDNPVLQNIASKFRQSIREHITRKAS